MKLLDKKQTKVRDDIVGRFHERAEALTEAVAVYDKAVAAAFGAVREEVEAYNDLVDEANGFMCDVTAECRDTLESRSEKWLESERGAEFLAAVDAWDTSVEQLNVEAPDVLDTGEIDWSALEDAPEEVE